MLMTIEWCFTDSRSIILIGIGEPSTRKWTTFLVYLEMVGFVRRRILRKWIDCLVIIVNGNLENFTIVAPEVSPACGEHY